MEHEEDAFEINYDLLTDRPLRTLEAKFNVMTAVQPTLYEAETYKPEGKITLQNEKGEDEVKEVPLINYIRWRSEASRINSNARIVEWSDGSMQIVVGEEMFDVMLSNMDNVRVGVLDRESDTVVVSNPIRHRMLLTRSEHSKKEEKVIDQNESNLKVKLVYSYYDKQSYNKEEFAGKFSKKKPEKKQSKSNDASSRFLKKRKRSNSSLDL